MQEVEDAELLEMMDCCDQEAGVTPGAMTILPAPQVRELRRAASSGYFFPRSIDKSLYLFIKLVR